MRPATLSEAARAMGADLEATPVNALVSGAATDSRKVREGDLFFALRGRTDGADFAPEAHLRGAVATVATRRLHVPTLVVDEPLQALQRLARWTLLRQDTPAVVGITGTVGKTTTKDALATILRHAGKRVSATAGNLNNEIGLPLTILASDPRTEVLVLEMGATHAGDIKDLCAIAPPDIGVLTAISPVHLDSFGTLEGLAAAKGELALSLPESGTLVAPAGAPHTATGSGRKLGRRITFARAGEADLLASGIEGTDEGLRFVASMAGVRRSSGRTWWSRSWRPSAAHSPSASALNRPPVVSPACGERAFGATSTVSGKTLPSTMTPTTHPLPPSRPYSGTGRIRHVDNVDGSSSC